MKKNKNKSDELDLIDISEFMDEDVPTPKPKKKKKKRNIEVNVITYGFLALFISLSVYFGYFLTFSSEEFINNPYNARINQMSKSTIRGNILSADGEILAGTNVDEEGKETRVYPYGNTFSHIIGYDTNGLMGVELDANFYLLRSHDFILNRVLNDFQNKKSQGDTVITTLDASLQEATYTAMSGYEGAVFAIEPSTGKILCCISKPDFNPNVIAYNYDSFATDSESSVFLNRATNGLYPPGSTFKIITSLEYLNEGGSVEDEFDCKGKLADEDYTMHCVNNKSHGHQTLREAFGNSCNVAYAQVGLSLDRASFAETANQLLFNETLPSKLSNSKASSFTLSPEDKNPRVMQTAIGQGKTLVTPMHMALIASAICNDGDLKVPYVVEKVENLNKVEVKSFESEDYGQILTEAQANELEELMRYVVTDGTASALNTDDYTVYGKTGSAEYTSNKDDTHSWFVGYAKDGDKEIALAIVLEGAGSGSKHAVPLAKVMFDEYFNEQ